MDNQPLLDDVLGRSVGRPDVLQREEIPHLHNLAVEDEALPENGNAVPGFDDGGSRPAVSKRKIYDPVLPLFCFGALDDDHQVMDGFADRHLLGNNDEARKKLPISDSLLSKHRHRSYVVRDRDPSLCCGPFKNRSVLLTR